MVSDDLIEACLAYDDCDPQSVLPFPRPAMTVDDLIELFLSFAEEDADVEFVSASPDFICVHGNLYEEVIARGRDGVFVYAVPTENPVSDECREP